MNRIILDYLNRWKWIYLSGFIVHSSVMFFAWIEEDKVTPFAILMGSAFLMMFEIMRSRGSRTLLSLPVTSKQLGRAWRFVSLTFPAMLYLVALAVSALAAALIKPTGLLNFERFLILAFFQTSLLGVMFFTLTGLPTSPENRGNFGDYAKNGFFGLLWGFSIPGCMFLAQTIPVSLDKMEVWQGLIFGFLFMATMVGWTRAETLVVNRAQLFNRVRSSTRQGSVNSGASKNRAEMRRFGGIPFHCLFNSRMAGLIGLLMIVFNWGWMQFFSGSRPDNDVARHQFTASQITFVVPFIVAVIGLAGLGQLRVLRVLPLSRKQISGMLVFWPMGFGVIFGFLVVLLHWLWFGDPFLWGHYLRALAGASFLILIVPAFLRLGFSMKGFLVIIVMFTLMQVSQILGEKQMKAALPYLWIVILILVTLAFGLTVRLLDTSFPWRAGALRMKGILRR